MSKHEKTLIRILQDRRHLCLGGALRTQLCQLQLLALLLESGAARVPAAADAESLASADRPC